jgi:hypothetical protein
MSALLIIIFNFETRRRKTDTDTARGEGARRKNGFKLSELGVCGLRRERGTSHSRVATAQGRCLLISLASSDRSVGVEHHADGAAHGAGRQVVGESCLDHARMTVGAADLAPDALVVGTSLFVLSFVNEGDTLSVVEQRRLGVVAALNLQERLLHELGALTALETGEHGVLVQSIQRV